MNEMLSNVWLCLVMIELEILRLAFSKLNGSLLFAPADEIT
jgi:hypothetical protein